MLERDGGSSQATEGTAMAMRSLTAVKHGVADLWVALCPEVGTTCKGDSIDAAHVTTFEVRDVAHG